MFAHRSPTATRPLRWLAALLLLLAACTDDATGDPSPDGGTSEGLCEVGTLGCECASGGTCATDLRGSQLLCQEGLCVPADCNAGANGCVCLGGTVCEAPGDVCDEGVCKDPECVAGTLSCDCLAGTCNAGLHCDEALGGGTCIDGTGYPGGACLSNRLCYGQNRCDTELSVCVFCEAGSQACAPREGDLCNQGLVLHAGRCLSPMDVPPSEDKRTCRMRCREDYSATGDFRACVDGFIEGCVGDLECVDGSCVVPGEDPPTCGGDNDCPDFQRCFGNDRCYSECEGNDDCLDGYSCYRHACRIPCVATNAASAACPSGMHCDTRDGSAGVCMPLPEPGPTPSTALRASFEPTPSVVALSALTPTAPVTIRTDSQIAETYEIVKIAQRVYDASGAELVDPLGTSTPLHFVRLTSEAGTAGAGGTLRVTAPARCGDACPAVTIEVTGSPSAAGWARWEGEIEVRHPTLGERRVRLGYQASADGRWTGNMYYFASFPEENVAEWRGRDGQPGTGLWDTEDVGNGLIQAWGTYRRGRMTDGVDALRALLAATSSESWNWPSVQAFCEEAFNTEGGDEYPGACFLFDDDRGNTLPRRYVDDLASAPIPTGATEYPIAMSVRTKTGENGLPLLEGVIDSAIALHYPGDPSVGIALESSPFEPNACAGGGDCVVYLDSFTADVRVGARMAMGGSSRCPTSFTPVSLPWLLPDFLGETDGEYSDECLDQRAPFPRGSDDNTNLSLANPFRDGRAIRRELRLMDGALINQRQMFVLFEERFTSSVHSEAFSAFGYMLLDHADQLVADEVFDAASEAAARADTVTADPGSTTFGPSCDPEWLEEIFGDDFTLPASLEGTVGDPTGDAARAVVRDVVDVMLTGRIGGGEGVVEYTVANGLSDNVHVLCVDNGLIDGGPDAGAPRPCPPVSRTRYFFVPDPYNANLNIRSLSCQQDGTTTDAIYEGSCGSQVETWSTSLPGVRPRPALALRGRRRGLLQ